MTEWISVLVDKIETPALIVSCLTIIILYRLLITSNGHVGKLSEEIQELAKIVAGNAAIVTICCARGRNGQAGRE